MTLQIEEHRHASRRSRRGGGTGRRRNQEFNLIINKEQSELAPPIIHMDHSHEGGGKADATYLPLSTKDVIEEDYTEDGSTDVYGRAADRNKTGNWKAAYFILGVELFESLGGFGVATNLTVYLKDVMHQNNASVATAISTWTGTCFLTPLLGAFLSDSYLGRYWVSAVFLPVYLLGMVITTLSAAVPSLRPPSCEGNHCPPSSTFQLFVLNLGLYLLSFGTGCVKSAVLPFGGDQFEETNPKEVVKKASFFNWFYFMINFGSLFSGIVLVWIEQYVSWSLGFGISTAFIAIAIIMFVCGTQFYRLQKPSGSAFKRMCQVLVASFRKRELLIDDEKVLHEQEEAETDLRNSRRLPHTAKFSFLDKAAIITTSDMEFGKAWNPWNLCTVTQVEELKTIFCLFPIWVTSIVHSAIYGVSSTIYIEQGLVMDSNFYGILIPAAVLGSVQVITVMLWVLVYDVAIVPVARKFTGNCRGLSQLQRMGIGRFFIILSMAIAAVVEMKRLDMAKQGQTMSLLWQLPQYIVCGASDMFNYIGQLEFFYDEAPESMRSACTALSMLTVALGSYLCSLLIKFVSSTTTFSGGAGWIPDDLNQGHLDYFFWTMVGISIVNMIAHIETAKRYASKRVFHE